MHRNLPYALLLAGRAPHPEPLFLHLHRYAHLRMSGIRTAHDLRIQRPSNGAFIVPLQGPSFLTLREDAERLINGHLFSQTPSIADLFPDLTCLAWMGTDLLVPTGHSTSILVAGSHQGRLLTKGQDLDALGPLLDAITATPLLFGESAHACAHDRASLLHRTL